MRRTLATLATSLLALAGGLVLPGTAQAATPGQCSYSHGGPVGVASCTGVPTGVIWHAQVGCFEVIDGQPLDYDVVGPNVTGDGSSAGYCDPGDYASSTISAVTVGVTGPQGRLVGYAGKCLDIRHGSTTVATPVQIQTCNGTGAQWWTVGSDNTVRGLGMCLNAVNAGTANGTPVEIYTCQAASTSEKWVPQPNGSLRNVNSGKCLDDLGFSTTDGTQIGIWDCNGAANQVWTVTP
jgi:hypothetical protein